MKTVPGPLRTYACAFSLPSGIERVFRLFSDPRLLNSLTPVWFDLAPITGVPEHLLPGVEIAYALRWRGLPLRWTSRIVEWDPPRRLTYEQVRGPYLFFRHHHLFETELEGTRVIDRVEYRVLGGALIDRLLVRPDLERIFTHRALAARRILGSTPSGTDSFRSPATAA